jgi:hypothetical protein
MPSGVAAALLSLCSEELMVDQIRVGRERPEFEACREQDSEELR